MLRIQRRAGESVTIGDNVTVTVTRLEHGRVELGIEAPREVAILRDDAVRRVPANQPTASKGDASNG